MLSQLVPKYIFIRYTRNMALLKGPMGYCNAKQACFDLFQIRRMSFFWVEGKALVAKSCSFSFVIFGVRLCESTI